MTSGQKDAERTCPLETKTKRGNKDHESYHVRVRRRVLVLLTVKGKANGLSRVVDFILKPLKIIFLKYLC